MVAMVTMIFHERQREEVLRKKVKVEVDIKFNGL